MKESLRFYVKLRDVKTRERKDIKAEDQKNKTKSDPYCGVMLFLCLYL